MNSKLWFGALALLMLGCSSESSPVLPPSSAGGNAAGGASMLTSGGTAGSAAVVGSAAGGSVGTMSLAGGSSAGTSSDGGTATSEGTAGAANGGSSMSGASGTATNGGAANGGTTNGGTANGGTANGGTANGGAGGTAGGPAPSGTPVFVAVGYAGRRIRSTDLGLDWTDDQTLGGGGDDVYLLRTVGFGNGEFVAMGYKILTSPDGQTWQEQTNPQNQWFGGVEFANGGFVATGGYGYSAHSSDGKSWVVGGPIPNNEASRSLAFGANEFVTATDPGNWFASSDSSLWSLLSGGHATSQIAYCNGAFSEYTACSGAFTAHSRATAAGTTIRVQDGELERSTNGVDFSPVTGSPTELEDIAVGYVQ